MWQLPIAQLLTPSLTGSLPYTRAPSFSHSGPPKSALASLRHDAIVERSDARNVFMMAAVAQSVSARLSGEGMEQGTHCFRSRGTCCRAASAQEARAQGP